METVSDQLDMKLWREANRHIHDTMDSEICEEVYDTVAQELLNRVIVQIEDELYGNG